MRRTVLVVCTVCLSAAQAPAAEKVVSIPLARVVLFAGGSGYFEHDGTVEGSAATVLSFRADRLGEILKTLVLTDLGGGRITVVSYGPPRGPGGKAPAMDLRGATSVADVLARLRGVEVVVLAPDKITGKIAGVETRPAKDGAGRDTTIDLVTPTGLRRVEMAGVTSVTPTDPAVRDELARALKQPGALGGKAPKVSVQIGLVGQGRRQVRIGYVAAARPWEISYRLDLTGGQPPAAKGKSPAPAAQPVLQGWVSVQNATDLDWRKVLLTLVTGEPGTDPRQAPRFQVRDPIDLAPGHSVMLRVVKCDVQAEQVSVYDARAESARPHKAVYLTNDTGTKLPAGIATVFDGQDYLGGTRIGPLAEGDKQLIRCGQDAAVSVTAATAPATRVNRAWIDGGVLHVDRMRRVTRTYTIRNTAAADRVLIIEHPAQAGARLVEPKEHEAPTGGLYRFRARVKASAGGTFVVAAEQAQSEQVALDKAPAGSLSAVAQDEAVAKPVREALRKLIAITDELLRQRQVLAELADGKRQIAAAQERIRQNLQLVGQDSDLGKRYLRKLDEQEDSIDRLEIQVREAVFQVERQEKLLGEYLQAVKAP